MDEQNCAKKNANATDSGFSCGEGEREERGGGGTDAVAATKENVKGQAGLQRRR